MVSPCCVKYLCCKGKSVKLQEKREGGEWFEQIRHKSRNQQHVLGQESIDMPEPAIQWTLDVLTHGIGATTCSDLGEDVRPECIPAPQLTVSSEYSKDSISDNDDGIKNNKSARTFASKGSDKWESSLGANKDLRGSARMPFIDSDMSNHSIIEF